MVVLRTQWVHDTTRAVPALTQRNTMTKPRYVQPARYKRITAAQKRFYSVMPLANWVGVQRVVSNSEKLRLHAQDAHGGVHQPDCAACCELNESE